jgi:LmbE family N-acetylglucosaminyl deacetylase
MTKNQKILAVFAHPDDEVFGIGGTLAHYARNGASVTLVCATLGEVGEIAEGTRATPETLGQIREAELACAAEALGIDEVILLNYRDSGMAGTDENKDPRAFMNAPAEVVVKRLVGIMRELQPSVVITFDPQGGYGHPDHIAAHYHTVAAFEAAGDNDRFVDLGTPWQPERLFYAVILRSQIEKFREQMAAAGEDMSDFENSEQQGMMGWPDELVHLKVDTSPVADLKLAAFDCHQTQFGGENLFSTMPESDLKEMMHFEYLFQAKPEPPEGLVLSGLF